MHFVMHVSGMNILSSHPASSSPIVRWPQDTVKLRESVISDHSQLEQLKSHYQMVPESDDAYSHIFDGIYPSSAGVAPNPMGWVLETTQFQLVGHIGNIYLEYYLNGKRITSASARSWVVDIDYRGSSFVLLHKFCTQPNIDLLLITTANLQTGRVFAKQGALKAPTGSYDRFAFWMIDHQKFASSLLVKKNIPLAQVLSFSVGAFLSAVSWVRNIGRCRPNKHTYITEVTTIDERFDRYWEKLRAQPNRLMCVRDRAAMAWRFQRPMRAGNAWIFAYYGSPNELAGYAVFLRQDSPDIGLRRMRLVDFQSEGDGAKFLHDAIEVALARCRDEGIHMLESVGFGNVRRKQIDALAPYQRQLPAWMFWYKASEKNPELAKALLNPDVWDPCTYDGDGCF